MLDPVIDVTREACCRLGRSREKWERFLRERFAAGTSSLRLPSGGTLKVRYTCMAHVPNQGMHLEKIKPIR